MEPAPHADPVVEPVPKSTRSYAFSAAASLLVAAYCNHSNFTGFLFLAAFFVWGSLNLGSTAAAGKRAKGLWGSVLALAALVSTAQIAFQLAVGIGGDEWAPSARTSRWLALAGFQRSEDPTVVILSVVPPLLVLAVTAVEVSAARDTAEPDTPEEGSDLDPAEEAAAAAAAEAPSPVLAWADGYSSAGVFVALAIVPAALAWPALLALPYLLIAAARVWRWAMRSSGGGASPAALSALQTYAGLHIALLYLWQIPALRAAALRRPAAWAGAFLLGWQAESLVPQVAMLAALHVLYAALGFLTLAPPDPGAADGSHFARTSWAAYAPQGDEEAAAAGEPLLRRPRQAQRPRTLAGLLLPVAAGIAVHCFEAACSYQKVAAIALCCYAMVEPSVVSAAVLLLSMWALVSPGGLGKHALVRLSPLLTAAFLLWHLAAYAATAVSPSLPIPGLLRSLGLYAFAPPPPVCLPLAAQAGCALVLAGLTHARGRHFDRHRQERAAAAAGRPQAAPEEAAAEAADAADEQDVAPELSSAFALLGRSGAQLLWHAGFLGVPAALFVVGVSQYDLLHAPYLLYLAFWLLRPCLRLTPAARMALVPHDQHLLLRAYASLHLAATYVLLVGHLPGLGHYLEPEGARTVLQALGLWQPSVRAHVLPVLALLLLATVHAGVGRWLQRQQPQPSTHPAPVLWWAAACVSTGSLLAVLAGYVLTLWDCPVDLLGLAYLAALACVLVWPPQRGAFAQPGAGGRPAPAEASCLPHLLRNQGARVSARCKLVHTGASAARWLPLALLAGVAGADLLLQYLVPCGLLTPERLRIPPRLWASLLEILGVEPRPGTWRLALRLARPFLMLGLLHLLRFGWALGVLQAQLEEAGEPGQAERRALAAQYGPLPLLRRALVLHSNKLLAAAVFAAALQQRSAVGWLLVGGLVATAPLLGGPKSWMPRRRRLLLAVLAAADLTAVLWMLALYATQVPWVRERLGAPDSPAFHALAWAGLASPERAESVERLLRFKCLILVATTLKRRSLRWRKSLPQPVKDAGGHGRSCCLFWPPPDGSAARHPASDAVPTWLDWWRTNAFARSLRLLVRDTAASVRRSTRRVLEAVDWSEDGPEQQRRRQQQRARGTWGAMRALWGSAARRRGFGQLRLLGLALQDAAEHLWQDWGLELNMAALLLAAFLAVNAISLALMLFLAAGMALPPRARRLLWRSALLPALATLLAWQYGVLLGWPPFLPRPPAAGEQGKHSRHPKPPPPSQSLHDWLGLHVRSLAVMWGFFLAFGLTAIQVHYDSWQRLEPLHRPSQPPVNGRTQSQGLALAERGEIEADAAAGIGPGRLWRPLRHADKQRWSWTDWLRFLFYRHFTDVVLTAVVALCTAENDVIHAAYLAIALLLFRRRDALRAQGNALFRWLPLYNFLVMLVTLAYQAPLGALLGARWDAAAASRGCNVAHLLGLYKAAGTSAGLSLSARGSLADMLLWAIARLQTRVFASRAYGDAMRVVAEEQAVEAAALAGKVEADRAAQAAAALDQSRLRHARALRVARLKAGITEGGGSYGINSALLELDLDRQDRVMSEEDRRLQATIPGVRPLHPSPSRAISADDSEPAAPAAAAPPAAPVKDPEESPPPARGPLAWLRWLSLKLQRPDQESYVCYALFVALFLTDFSLLALALQLLLFCYALLAQPAARLFWQAVLVFTEGVLIAQYVYQIPTRLHCAWVSPGLRWRAELAGIHGAGLRSIPIFCVYLATLMHTYRLTRHQVLQQQLEQQAAVQQSPLSPAAELSPTGGSPRLSRRPSLTLSAPLTPRHRRGGDATGQAFSRGARALWRWLCSAAAGAWEFLMRVCTSAERPLHFIKVKLLASAGETEAWQTPAGALRLEASLQAVIDFYRALDLQAAQRRRAATSSGSGSQAPAAAGGSAAEAEGPEAGDGTVHAPDPSGWVDLSTVGPLRLRLFRVVPEGDPGLASLLVEVIPVSSSQATGGQESWPIRSLKPAKHAAQTLQRFRWRQGLPQEAVDQPPEPFQAEDSAEAEAAGSGSSGGQLPPQNAGGNDRHGPGVVHAEPADAPQEEAAAADAAAAEAQLSATFFIEAGRGAAVRGQSLVQRSGKTAAAAPHAGPELPEAAAPGSFVQPEAPQGPPAPGIELARLKLDSLPMGFDEWTRGFRGTPDRRRGQRAPASAAAAEVPADALRLRLADVEWHSRKEQDWYAATVAVDLLAFLYAALFYQAVTASARTLADINGDRVVPLDFLAALLFLFVCAVLDRLFYTLGSHAGKAALLAVQMDVLYWYCLSLFWSPRTGPLARTHLRVFAALKSLSFVFSALQLRSGYPSPASYRDGQGRHALVFMRQPNMLGSAGFSAFAAIPFLYELRALLDWSCTATTLTLFDWLKLEDIHTSLFVVTVNRKYRELRPLGSRQPRYLKFFQGTLLFSALLLLLWVPLLAFSSGNPTYQVPNVVAFGANTTLGITRGNASDHLDTLTFPLWAGGAARSRRNWVAAAEQLPREVRDTYSPEQTKLLCLAQDSDTLWPASPPQRAAMLASLRSHNASFSIGYHITRDAPLAGAHGGPDCEGARQVQLSSDAREQLADVLQGKAENATLASATFLNGSAAPAPAGSRPLHSYFWQLRAGDCLVNTGVGAKDGWPDVGVACNLSLAEQAGERWWRLRCELLTADGLPLNASAQPHWTACSARYAGPRLVAVLERVQGGLIGQTLSSFGILGLYITVVLAIGRFLRLATQNARARIQYEDLPSTKRLVTLCQDIYIARAEGELALEEELYWALINIYRLPNVLFELTKKKES